MIYLLTICFLFGRAFCDDRRCSVSLPSSDERSCDYGKPEEETVRPQKRRKTVHVDESMVTKSQYEKAINDAKDGKIAGALPILRKAAESFKSDVAYNNLCAFLLDWGHQHDVYTAEKIYKESEESCKSALGINPFNSDVMENLDAIRKTREIRGMSLEPIKKKKKKKPQVGRFVGQRPKKRDRKKRKMTAMGFNEVYTAKEETLRVYPGEMDKGDLKYKLYNGSSTDPRWLTLHLGEVYAEDEFLSENELSSFMAIIDRGLLEEDGSKEKGPAGAVLVGKLLSIASELTKDEQLLIAHIRERVVNRANDLRGLDSPMYSYVRGVRAHGTSILRYKKGGRHNVHHDNDFINRCLTASIALNDGFEGGEFNLHTTKNLDDRTLEGFPIIGTVTMRAGRLLLFLSQSVNSVSEVTSGTRDTLFVWMTCDTDAEYQLDHPLELVDDRKVWKAIA